MCCIEESEHISYEKSILVWWFLFSFSKLRLWGSVNQGSSTFFQQIYPIPGTHDARDEQMRKEILDYGGGHETTLMNYVVGLVRYFHFNLRYAYSYQHRIALHCFLTT